MRLSYLLLHGLPGFKGVGVVVDVFIVVVEHEEFLVHFGGETVVEVVGDECDYVFGERI